jgi:hypothetical protein
LSHEIQNNDTKGALALQGREPVAIFNGCFRWYVKPDIANCARPYAPGTRGGKWRLYSLPSIPKPYICKWTDKELKRLGYNDWTEGVPSHFEIVRLQIRTGEIDLNSKPKYSPYLSYGAYSSIDECHFCSWPRVVVYGREWELPEKWAANPRSTSSRRFNDFDPDLFDFIGSPFWTFSLGYRPTHEDLCKLLKENVTEVTTGRTKHHWQSREILHFSAAPPEHTPVYHSSMVPRGKKYTGEFVFCPSCKRWDVSGIQRTKCNLCGSKIEYIPSDRVHNVLCGSTIEYVLSDRWRCKGTYIADKGFPAQCYARGRSPNVAGDGCAFGCSGSTLRAAKAVKITLGYHKLTQISETEYNEEICFVGEAPHTISHVQKLDRDRIDIRRRLTRGSVGSWRGKVRQAVDVVEPLINTLTGDLVT